jgi:hypothetical protein
MMRRAGRGALGFALALTLVSAYTSASARVVRQIDDEDRPAISPGTATSATGAASRLAARPQPRAFSATVAANSDSTLLFFHTFDDPGGGCSTQGWVGESRAGLIFMHVSDRFVRNGDTLADGSVVNMGTKALWVGADSTSAPDEVKNWVQPYGYGNGWSQRFISPLFSLAGTPDAVLKFDGFIDLAFDTSFSAVAGTTQEFFEVQGLKTDGSWVKLKGHYWSTAVSNLVTGPITGKAPFRCEVRLNQDGNNALGLASSTRLRVVLQTSSTLSNEDGGQYQGIGAAWVDNLTLKSAGSGLDVLPALNFEDGTMGSWTTAAFNTGLSGGPSGSNGYVRDLVSGIPLPASEPGVASGIDVTDSTCVMKFTDASGYLPLGVFARMTSPWFPINGDAGFLMKCRTKLAELGRFTRVWARVKRSVDARATEQTSAGLWYGDSGADADVQAAAIQGLLPAASFTPHAHIHPVSRAGFPTTSA